MNKVISSIQWDGVSGRVKREELGIWKEYFFPPPLFLRTWRSGSSCRKRLEDKQNAAQAQIKTTIDTLQRFPASSSYILTYTLGKEHFRFHTDENIGWAEASVKVASLMKEMKQASKGRKQFFKRGNCIDSSLLESLIILFEISQ